jgi:hypothetical protein
MYRLTQKECGKLIKCTSYRSRDKAIKAFDELEDWLVPGMRRHISVLDCGPGQYFGYLITEGRSKPKKRKVKHAL